MINMLRWYLGDITDIKSQLGHRLNMDMEDSALCLAKFESGARAVITAGWFAQKNRVELKLFGTVDHAEMRQQLQNPLATAAQVLSTGTSKYFQPHFAELQYFTHCVRKGLTPSPTGKDGLKDLEAISLAYRNQITLA